MCLVLDVNVFGCVFDRDNSDHLKYAPVLNWLINGNGKLVVGGSKYFDELGMMPKYIRLLAQLSKMEKVVSVSDGEVDAKETAVRDACQDRDFDDPHMVALLAISGCKIFCSGDSRSYKYIKMRRWYRSGVPRIYSAVSYRRPAALLNDSNIAAICRPCLKLNKQQQKQLM